MYKARNSIGPSLLNDIFRKANYNGPVLRNNKDFLRPNVKTHRFGEKSLENLGNVMWNLLPNSIKQLDTLDKFKSHVKKWKPEKYPCYLCKDYLQGVGLIELCNCQFCN